MNKLISAIALGIGLTVVAAGVARAQLGDLGEAAKRGATEAAKKEVAEKAGLGTPAGAVVSPATAVSPAAASPAIRTSPASVSSPTAAASPAIAASPASTATPVTARDMGGMLMEEAGKKAVGEAGKKVAPKVP